MARVLIERLQKAYGSTIVLDVPALDIAEGEFFSLLGPSGCGKTTMLRSIAGAVEPDAGRIAIGDRDVTHLPPERRRVGMVFQKYALFPHLTVRENVAYGLESRGFSRTALDDRVRESLVLVAMNGLDDRYPHQLSGGQQQRVATARAIAYRPDVLLLDEPFSNLDAKLRVSLRSELKRLQRSLAITTVFVTHDQQEALALSDRIAVMSQGRVEQVGTPEEVYDRPASAFVADFVGATNLLHATIVAIEADGQTRVGLGDVSTLLVPSDSGFPVGTAVTLMVKPERVYVTGTAGEDEVAAELTGASYLGAGYSYTLLVGGQRVEARQDRQAIVDSRSAKPGDPVSIRIDAAAVRMVRR